MPIPVNILQFTEKFRALPQALRDFLSAEPVSYAISDIQATYQISSEMTLRLSQSIAWFTTGFISANEFANSLKSIAPQEKLAEFQNDVIEKIFKPFSPQLRAHGINFENIFSAHPSYTTTPAPTKSEPSILPKAHVSEPISSPAPKPEIIAPPKPEPEMPMPKPEPMPITTPPKITVAPNTTAPSASEIPAAHKEEKTAEFRPIRYTTPIKPPEVPKVIDALKPEMPVTPPPPAPVAPIMPPPVSPPLTPKPPQPITPSPQKPVRGSAESVIDLSTFQFTQKTNQSNEPPAKSADNVVDLR